MPADIERMRRRLQQFDFTGLLVDELGWNCHSAQPLQIPVDSATYPLNAVAEKCGMVVYECPAGPDGGIPPHPVRRKVERQAAKSAYEHLIIFTDAARTTQLWQWVRREKGKPLACREHAFRPGEKEQALLEKLQGLGFELAEEEQLTISDVTSRARKQLDVDKVTKRFYDRFKREHDTFLRFIDGIKEKADCEWYASLMLNRMMFVYFIQKRGFLDGDPDYLRNRLQMMQQKAGKDRFLRFYRLFLLRLFHEGFGKPEAERAPDLAALLGNVPFLNGGLFDVHELEREHPDIQIPDQAFQGIFDFFDGYTWHLDERPLRADDEINPDVLGYIFEKYINQKQMGAYYTKEDITEYIAKNCVVPFILDRVDADLKKKGKDPEFRALFQLLAADPDRYIYDPVKHGVALPLPPEIEKGVDTTKPNLIERRAGWNKPASSEYALPTEIWREVVARRQRYAEVKARLLAIGKESGTGVSPVDFLPFQPSDPLDITQRNLPHWQQSHVTYFVTFRLGDSLSAAKLKQWEQEKKAWLKRNPKPWTTDLQAEYARLFPRRLNEWLDAGEGSCLLAKPNLAEIAENTFRHFDGQRYILDEFVVMPNHVHVLFAPIGGHQLSEILHAWKSFTAHEINKAMKRQGSVWLDESYDHIVRSEEQLEFYRAYIKQNPLKARLVSGKSRSGKGMGLQLTDGANVQHVKGEKITGGTPVPLSTNDLITLNLNIRQFAQDCIENATSPDILWAFWRAIEEITVLDPTCGSGAFLFAAVNVLEPLYEACLDRMKAFMLEWESSTGVSPVSNNKKTTGETPVPPSGKKKHPNFYKDFAAVIARVEKHANEKYFIFKSIIIRNLYGVDIMDEAVEICKLRLFLKLAAQIEPDYDEDNLGIEPLPDIDFNIRAGNTLVGFATEKQAEDVIRHDLLAYNTVWPEVQRDAKEIAELFSLFRQQQTEIGGAVSAQDKAHLRAKLAPLEDRLNAYLADTYGVTAKKAIKDWVHSHKPFHWFIEFYEIMAKGGFNVIIGNPPWVEFAKVQHEYTLRGFVAMECGNLWAYVTERSLTLLGATGRLGLIVPMSLVCTERMRSIQELVGATGMSWVANFESDSNPGQLFDGVKQNVTILLHQGGRLKAAMTTRMFRFFQEFRDFVFPVIQYTDCPPNPLRFGFPKISSHGEKVILDRMFSKRPLATRMAQTSAKPVLVHRIAHYYIKCLDFVPHFRSDRDGIKKSEDYKEYPFAPPIGQYVASINSSAFYFYWQVFFDSFKAGKLCVESFPFGEAQPIREVPALEVLARDLMKDMRKRSTRLKAEYAATGSVEYDQFYPRDSKPIIDEIDRVLAQHYGFTEEELDFIINYDIKYRMGLSGDSDEE